MKHLEEKGQSSVSFQTLLLFWFGFLNATLAVDK